MNGRDLLVQQYDAMYRVVARNIALATVTDESLAEKMPDAFGRPSTRAGVLAGLVVHQWYHAGQLGMARRAAGKKAAILAPGQTAPL